MRVIEQLRRMSPERFLHIYDSLAKDGYGPLDGEVAKAMRFRPHAIKKLPMEKRARRARSILENSSHAELCYEVFGSYLMTQCRELVTSFLDKTGVEHDEGIIQNVETAVPKVDALDEAVKALDADYSAEDVTLYLSLAAEQWPQVKEVEALWRGRLEA